MNNYLLIFMIVMKLWNGLMVLRNDKWVIVLPCLIFFCPWKFCDFLTFLCLQLIFIQCYFLHFHKRCDFLLVFIWDFSFVSVHSSISNKLRTRNKIKVLSENYSSKVSYVCESLVLTYIWIMINFLLCFFFFCG